MSTASKLTDLAALYRQLSILTGAGISVASSAAVLATQGHASVAVRSPRGVVMRRALETIKQDLYQGYKMSQAMARWPQLFPQFHLALITEGETTGQLDVALMRLAEITERDLALYREMRAQLRWPTIALNFGIPVCIIAFVTGNTKLVPWIAAVILVVMLILIRGAGTLISAVQGQTKPAALKFTMAIPVLGSVAKKVSIAYFVRTLGLLYGAGVPIAHALLYAADACGNPWLADPIRRIVPRIESGANLRETLASTGLFPSYILAVLSTAELTGSLDAQLTRASAFLEDEVERQMRVFCIVLGMVMLVVDGGLTTVIAVTFWKHYYENMINNPFGAHSF